MKNGTILEHYALLQECLRDESAQASLPRVFSSEHLFEASGLDLFQFFKTLAMKGDLGVEGGEVGGDGSLLGEGGNKEGLFK